MMILGLGTDIVEIERIEQAAQKRAGFLDRIFSEEEQRICGHSPRPWESYAGRFAAKEAFLKVCGCGIFAVDLRGIEVHRSAQGEPYFVVQADAARLMESRGIRRMHLSISHEKEMALAVAIGEG